MPNESNSTWRLIAAVLLACMGLVATAAHSQAITLAQPDATQTSKISATLDWAENQSSLQSHLGAKVQTQVGQGYVFRQYPSGNYIAATASEFYAWGPSTNFVLTYLGKVDDLYCGIAGCTPAPECQAPKVWNEGVGACIAPIGIKLFNPKAPPMEGNNPPAIGGAVWKQALRDGTIQIHDTGMILAGINNEPLVVAFFINPFTKSTCVTLLYKKNGASIYPNPLTYGGCSTEPIDWVMGTSDGYILHAAMRDNASCLKEVFKLGTQFERTRITCP